MIYIFGDSHSSVFTINNDIHYMNDLYRLYINKHFSSYRTQPFTCYNLINKLDFIDNKLNELNILCNDYLFFCYGEVDIRCHIGFHVNKEKNVEIIVEETVERYIKFLLYYKSKYKNIGIYAPIASGSYNGRQGNGRPSYKNEIERNKITLIFNNILEQKCKENNILFKSIYLELINHDSTTKNKFYVKDNIHLNIFSQELLEDKFGDII